MGFVYIRRNTTSFWDGVETTEIAWKYILPDFSSALLPTTVVFEGAQLLPALPDTRAIPWLESAWPTTREATTMIRKWSGLPISILLFLTLLHTTIQRAEFIYNLWWCAGHYRCTYVTCPSNYQCDSNTGYCVQMRNQGNRCASITCPSGSACDSSSGLCRMVAYNPDKCAGVQCK